MRRTKIVATLGPATDGREVTRGLIAAGTDVVRLNYSHGSHDEHAKRAQRIRREAKRQNAELAVMADLQGPKIRIRGFRDGPIELEEGDEFTLDAELRDRDGNAQMVGVSYKDLVKDVRKGDILLIDDGRIILQVDEVHGPAVECIVLLGGELSDNKGLNRLGGGLSASALTRKDRQDIAHAVSLSVDYIALSFPRDANDVRAARRIIEKAGSDCGVIAKIERAEALDAIDGILEVSDGIMIARGDLGVEIGDAALPPVQKRLISRARNSNRLVITATQMMQSMVESHIPTRAEVFDVANAVLDGTDAVMLSAETSIGHYPVRAVEAMSRVCQETEEQAGTRGSDYRISQRFERVDEAIAMATMYTANHVDTKAIAALTETGGTTLWMSRVNSNIPIFAFMRNEKARRRVNLYRGVYPVEFDVTHTDPQKVYEAMIETLKSHGVVRDGDNVIITKGDLRGRKGGTNSMKIVKAGHIVDQAT
jgi:pyruvate kinase